MHHFLSSFFIKTKSPTFIKIVFSVPPISLHLSVVYNVLEMPLKFPFLKHLVIFFCGNDVCTKVYLVEAYYSHSREPRHFFLMLTTLTAGQILKGKKQQPFECWTCKPSYKGPHWNSLSALSPNTNSRLSPWARRQSQTQIESQLQPQLFRHVCEPGTVRRVLAGCVSLLAPRQTSSGLEAQWKQPLEP